MSEILKGENRYVLAKSNETWHIFPAHLDPKSKCSFLNNKWSICHNLLWSDAIDTKVNCLSEKQMREKCLEIGRPICGSCISHLYKNVSDEEQKILNS